jgi:hypothetical protein
VWDSKNWKQLMASQVIGRPAGPAPAYHLSPDGKRVAYLSEFPALSIKVVSFETGGVSDLLLNRTPKAPGGRGAGTLHQRSRGNSSDEVSLVEQRGLRSRNDACERTQSRFGVRSAPWVFAIECLVEVVHVGEFLARIGRLAHEESEVDQREHDVTNVGGALHSPALEDEARHDAEALAREVAARQRELAAGDVASLGQPLLAELERGQDEEIGALVVSRLAQPDPVHDPVSKCQFSHASLCERAPVPTTA